MKKQPKKLTLNTETLRDLDRSRLEDAAGGSVRITDCITCNTNTYVCSGCMPCA